ncbi:MAG: hypothetical protein HQ515_21560 [Phycisphaeraceae bacterium]|nr:hypothetical protein [Phycisphaeraceae bacterium]
MIASASVGVSVVSLLMIGVLVLGAGWFILRLTGVVRLETLPRPERKSSNQSRWVEAVMLLCGGLVIWVFTATNSSTGGRLLSLDQLHPAFARINVIVAALSLLGVLCSCLIAARWSSSLGVVLCAAVLIIYPSMLNGPRQWLESFVPEEARTPRTTLYFDLVTCDLQDAEFYVNGVSLGTLPVILDQADFLERVPVWVEEPARLDRSDIPDSLIDYKSPNSSSLRTHSLYQRIRFKSPEGRETEYYAQVKHQDKWCYATGSGGSGGGGGRYVHQRLHRLNFLSPDHEQRLERLLDWARIRDYDVPDSWFETMETYRYQGIKALLEKESNEPGIGDLLDEWASLKFGLDKVRDEDTAWQAFETLCQTVTKSQAYSTEGLEGRAVIRLAPRLSMEKLTARAKVLLRNVHHLSWSQWLAHGKPHFGISRNRSRFMITGKGMSYARGGRGKQLPIPGYAVAHALWVLYEQGNDTAIAALQEQLMPLFIAQFHRGFPGYRFVCFVGGPALERFLIRQNWQADPEQLAWEQIMRLPEGDMNGWFYMLANLDTPVGREFRQRHREKIFQMADPIDLDHSSEDVDFLFLDLDQGKDSLAFQYWPRFLRKTPDYDRKGNRAMKYAVEYLVRMGTVSEPGMYVEVFKAIEEWTFYTMENFEVLSSLPFSHRESVCEALHEAMAGDISHLGLSRKSTEEARARMLLALETVLASEEEKAEQLYEDLVTEKSRHYTDKWLGQMAEDHAMVPLLAKSDRADLKRLALYAIESFPSSAHRALLGQLLPDSEPEVSTAARAIRNNLDKLATTPLETLKAD